MCRFVCANHKEELPLKKFASYISRLEFLIDISPHLDPTILAASIEQALDGEPSRSLRALVPLEILRKNGIFFTGSRVANWAVELLSTESIRENGVTDPACGAGDLLVACSRRLPVHKSLKATLDYWGRLLAGYDLEKEFVRATKLRLLLAALYRVGQVKTETIDVDEFFPMIKVGNGLTNTDFLTDGSSLLVNPPYTKTTNEDIEWAAGHVSQAGVFIESYVSKACSDKIVIAILPEVLRTGSRYGKWRKTIEANAQVCRVQSLGRFDKMTDVDVFLVKMIVRHRAHHVDSVSWSYPKGSAENVGSLFEVAVGPVVPHRDRHKGDRHPFIYPRNLPTWTTVTRIVEARRYSGKVFESPFVVVRRTSGPRDNHRCAATLINLKEPAAVENHLLVLTPFDGSKRRCKELMRVLRSPDTNKWLNKRMRCRHLTVSSLKELPWWKSQKRKLNT